MLHEFLQWWKSATLEINLVQTLLASLVLISSLLFRKFFVQIIINQVINVSEKRKWTLATEIIETVSGPLSLSFVMIGIVISSEILGLPEGAQRIIANVVRSIGTFILFWLAYRASEKITDLIDSAINTRVGRKGQRDSISTELKYFIRTLLRAVILIFGAISVLQSLGIEVTMLVGGATIVTAAVGFAAKDSISNLFGSFAVFLDQTFRKGDWIKTPDVEGTVENVGIRTTQIRQFDKALVTIPNDKLANTALVNFSRMTNRRIRWVVTLEYGPSAEQLSRIMQRLRDYLENNDDIETDPKKVTTLIYLDKFADSGIDVFCYFFTKTTNWKEYMRVKEQCILDFMDIIHEEGADFAYPTRKNIVVKD